MSSKFTKGAGTLAIASTFLWFSIVAILWVAAVLESVRAMDPNASGAVFSTGYFSFQLADIRLWPHVDRGARLSVGRDEQLPSLDVCQHGPGLRPEPER
jgi:hypothetical protein